MERMAYKIHMYYALTPWVSWDNDFIKVISSYVCRKRSNRGIRSGVLHWGLLHRNTGLDQTVKEGPGDWFRDISLRSLPTRIRGWHILGCPPKETLQIAPSAVFHQEVAVPFGPINYIGHLCHLLGYPRRRPGTDISPGMMRRIEALYYVRCASELLLGGGGRVE
jgi:hypothetical protein